MHHESTQSPVRGFIFTLEKLTLTQTTQFQSSISGNILDTPLHTVLLEVTPVHTGTNVNSSSMIMQQLSQFSVVLKPESL